MRTLIFTLPIYIHWFQLLLLMKISICIYVTNFSKEYPQIIYSRSSPASTTFSSITFDSNFESGNLYCVLKLSNTHYLLFLQYDPNSIGHTQWFYFQATNTVKGFTVHFEILNLVNNFLNIVQSWFIVCCWHENMYSINNYSQN